MREWSTRRCAGRSSMPRCLIGWIGSTGCSRPNVRTNHRSRTSRMSQPGRAGYIWRLSLMSILDVLWAGASFATCGQTSCSMRWSMHSTSGNLNALKRWFTIRIGVHNRSRSGTPNDWRKQASNLPSVAGPIATITRWQRGLMACNRRN